jgi:hypothetical protein
LPVWLLSKKSDESTVGLYGFPEDALFRFDLENWF